MTGFRSILIVSEGARSDADAFGQALNLAHRTGAAVAAVVVRPALPGRLDLYESAYEASLREHVQRSLNEARTTLGPDASPAVPVSVEIGEAPGERIVRRVLRDGHDLVLKSVEPQPLGGLEPLDLELLRKCPRPVWLSRPIARPRHEVRVAAAIDPRSDERAGHDLSIDLLHLARTLADLGDGRLAVISCWECAFEGFLLHNPWQSVPYAEVQKVVASEELDHRAALDRVLRESGVGGAISVHHVRGEPGPTIPATADELGVDILVMGTVARTGIPGLLMGNTAETVVRRLACSLVAVKPPGFVSPVKLR